MNGPPPRKEKAPTPAASRPKHDSSRTLADPASKGNGMTKAERDSLLQVVRLRAKVAKTDTVAYSAKLRADFEQQLDTHYSWDQDATWKAMADLMKETAEEAEAKVAARNRELGIPDWAAPSIGWYWRSQGEQAVKGRKAELRRLAHTQIEAIEKEAKAKIDRVSSEVQTQLFASGLTSEAAKAFLAQMPSIESLMPPLELTKIEAMLGTMSNLGRLRLRY